VEIDRLLDQQRLDGSWPHGTAGTLCVLADHGYDQHSARVRRALDYLFQQQQADGSFGDETELVVEAMLKMGLTRQHPIVEAALRCRS
jgi:squalene cyclase